MGAIRRRKKKEKLCILRGDEGSGVGVGTSRTIPEPRLEIKFIRLRDWGTLTVLAAAAAAEASRGCRRG